VLSGFPASSTVDTDVQLRAYLIAVADVSRDVMERAGRAFLRGKVIGHNKAFAPSAAEFAAECDRQQLVIAAENRPRVERQEDKPMSEAEKVAPWKLALLNSALQGNVDAHNRLAEMFPHIGIKTKTLELE
jgi:uncharacterized protein (DUF1800 family)